MQQHSSSRNSIFIEKDNLQNIQEMKELLVQPRSESIKSFLFPMSKDSNVDIHSLTNSQINKSQQYLAHHHRQTLKIMLKSTEGGDHKLATFKKLKELSKM